MKRQFQDQFDSLESAHEFVVLLAATVAETKQEIDGDTRLESSPSRRLDALRMARYDLEKLELHVARTSKILNDLRTIRGLLFDERATAHAA